MTDGKVIVTDALPSRCPSCWGPAPLTRQPYAAEQYATLTRVSCEHCDWWAVYQVRRKESTT